MVALGGGGCGRRDYLYAISVCLCGAAWWWWWWCMRRRRGVAEAFLRFPPCDTPAFSLSKQTKKNEEFIRERQGRGEKEGRKGGGPNQRTTKRRCEAACRRTAHPCTCVIRSRRQQRITRKPKQGIDTRNKIRRHILSIPSPYKSVRKKGGEKR